MYTDKQFLFLAQLNRSLIGYSLLNKQIHNYPIKTTVLLKKLCNGCGIEFETYYNSKQFCSKECHYKNHVSVKYSSVCNYCGNEFKHAARNTKYCSSTCAANAKNSNLYNDGKRKCSSCNKMLDISFFKLKRHDGYLRSNCRECENKRYRNNHSRQLAKIRKERWQQDKGWIGKSCKIFVNTCPVLNLPFVSKTKRKISYGGLLVLSAEKEYKEIKIKRDIEILKLQRLQETISCWCRECGNDFDMPKYIKSNYSILSKPKEYCSLKCSKKASKRKWRLSYKTNKNKAFVENVDPFVVFDKHGWKCQDCGIDTPRKLRGTYEYNAPELDHIMPLSKGGKHEYSNVQLLCRSCNSEKKDRIPYKLIQDAKSGIRAIALSH